MSKSSFKWRRLGFEGLEGRQLLTGNVDASLDVNGNLNLTGDFENNHVVVSKGALVGQVVVRGGRSVASDDGSRTRINGSETAVTFNVTGGILFDLGEGNDRLLVTNFGAQGNVIGNLGIGNDQIGLQSSNNGPIKFRLNDGSVPAFGKVTVSGLVNVDGNVGSDWLALYDATISGSLTFTGGDGTDRFTSRGTSTSSNRVGGSVQLTPGAGDDSANVFRMEVGGNFRIDDGSAVNSASVKLVSLRVNADILMNLSIRRDYVQLLGEDATSNRFQARSVIINTGDGNDRVFVERGTMFSLTLTTGNGSEVFGTDAGIRLTNLNINNDLVLDTGDDRDIAFLNIVTAENIEVITQGGDDRVTANNITTTNAVYETFDGNDFLGLHDSQYTRITVKLNDGDDTLQVRSLNVTQSAFFNGNLGTNIYQDQGGNSFEILTKLNFQ